MAYADSLRLVEIFKDIHQNPELAFMEVRTSGIVAKELKTFESMATTAFIIFDNPLHTSKTGTVGILWSFNSYDEWSKDTGTKKACEKLFGDGSWQQMLDEWNDIVVDYNAEIRCYVR